MNEDESTRLCEPDNLNDDLTVVDCPSCDIMCICESSGETLDEYFDDDNLTTIWKRKEIEMTIAEIEKKLGITGLKIIKEN